MTTNVSVKSQIPIVETVDPDSDADFAKLRELVENFSDPFELVRELLSNSSDAGATSVWVAYQLDQTTNKIVFSFEDNGEGLREYTDANGKHHDRLAYFFKLGKSDKRGTSGKIGRKGFGSKIALLSKRVIVESRYEANGQIVEVHGELSDPYTKLINSEDLIAIKTLGGPVGLRNGPAGIGTKITIEDFQSNNSEFYDTKRLIEYIRWFTAGGSVKPLLDPSRSSIRIEITDTYGQVESFPGIHNPPPQDCDPKQLPDAVFAASERELIDGQELIIRSRRFCKRVVFPSNDQIFVLNGKQIKISVCAWVLGRSQKDTFANSDFIPDRDRFGVWLAQEGILVERRYSWIVSSPLDCNYHVIVNCDQFDLNADRTRIKGNNNEIYRLVKQHFETFFKENIVEAYKPFFDLRAEEESQRKFIETRADNRKRIESLSDREAWTFSRTKSGIESEPVYETEVCALLCAMLSQHPTKFPFRLQGLFPTGTDAAVEVTDSTTGIKSSTLYEVETLLSHFIAHRHPPLLANGIICWKNDLKGIKTPRRLRAGQEQCAIWRGGYLEIFSGMQKMKDINNGNVDSIHRIPVFALSEICDEIEQEGSVTI